jgi:hypothetical protein
MVTVLRQSVNMWKDKKEIEEKLNQWKGMSRKFTMNISGNLNTNNGIRVNNTLAKEVGILTCKSSKINSERKTDKHIIIKIQNKF